MLSVGLTVEGEAYVWGGMNKICPAITLDTKENLLDVRVTGDKVYALNN